MWFQVTPLGIFSPFDEPAGEGIPASPLLITPIRQKKYDMYQSTINNLWQQSADSLKVASKIVIVGYSFPPTDTRALELLESALNERHGKIAVEIVAPDATEIVSRIKKEHLAGAKSVTAHEMKFEEYLQMLASNIPSLMKKAAAEHDEVREWLEKIYALVEMSGIISRDTSEDIT